MQALRKRYLPAGSGSLISAKNNKDLINNLNKLSNGGSYFEFGKVKKFYLENKNAIFDNVAECKGNSMSATNIKSIKPGTAKEIEQGRWEVVTKTQVEFIK